jgi:gluconokinase
MESIRQAIVVMGVSGCGKSTFGAMLADALHCSFIEGDRFHSAANVAKMHAGQPLSDEDRWPWLEALGAAAASTIAAEGRVVMACSALKRVYRERLATTIAAPTAFLLLDVAADELNRRLIARHGHFMPASLLESQLQTLERPGLDECALTVVADVPFRTLLSNDEIQAFLSKSARALHGNW